MCIILIAVGMHTNPYIAYFTTKPCSLKSIYTANFILLQKKTLGTYIEHHDVKT